MAVNKSEIIRRLESLSGEIGMYYKNLVTGVSFGFKENEMYQAASVIKLPVYAVIMKLYAEGKLDLEETLVCRSEDMLPSCGTLRFFPAGTQVSIRTLCALMITVSDNTATNLLIRRIGLEFLNEQFKELGMEKTHLERLLFDSEGSAKGLENKIVPAEIGAMLESIYRRRFISEDISVMMENLLLEQQVNHKIPGYLSDDIPVAHKTGEDDGITNDVAIVYAKEPFILCFASNFTNVPETEIAIREISLALTEN